MNDITIYRAYIEAKSDPDKTVTEVAKELGVTRAGLYQIVRRIEDGNVAKIRKCTEKSKLDCLWEYKYKVRYAALPKNRKESTVKALRQLINDMHDDEFNVSNISVYLGKDRSTVLHHLQK